MDYRPPTLIDNIFYQLAQFGPGRLRAHLDLFVGRFSQNVLWNSGTGDGIFALYGLVRALRPDAVIEIGSARGRTACAMALACSQNAKGKVYAIDPHIQNDWSDKDSEESYDFFMRRLRSYELEPWCEIIRKTSKEALATPPSIKADLVFIDGDHTYEGVKLDFELCKPLVSEHGLIVFHDSSWEHFRDSPFYREDLGVARFLDELRAQSYEGITLPAWPGLTILQAAPGGFPYLLSSS